MSSSFPSLRTFWSRGGRVPKSFPRLISIVVGPPRCYPPPNDGPLPVRQLPRLGTRHSLCLFFLHPVCGFPPWTNEHSPVGFGGHSSFKTVDHPFPFPPFVFLPHTLAILFLFPEHFPPPSFVTPTSLDSRFQKASFVDNPQLARFPTRHPP